ncbi:hypothetical protein ACSQ67_020260 [Phaseolus vulgaris]
MKNHLCYSTTPPKNTITPRTQPRRNPSRVRTRLGYAKTLTHPLTRSCSVSDLKRHNHLNQHNPKLDVDLLLADQFSKLKIFFSNGISSSSAIWWKPREVVRIYISNLCSSLVQWALEFMLGMRFGYNKSIRGT